MSEPKIPRQKNKPSMLEAALQYLKRGWNLIPVAQNKHPYLTSWKEYQSKKVTEKEVREWWTKWPNANIAILTGAISDIVVIDADSIVGIESIKPYLTTETLTVTTGGGGKHYYFQHPGTTVMIPCTVRFLPGIDSRGDGGYVVVPPSLHRSGRRYSWDSGAMDAADIPTQLLELLRGPSVPSGSIKEWASEIPEGHRDDELTRRAGYLLRTGMSATKCLSIIDAINTIHCKPPLENAQVRKIVNSIAGREAAKQKNATQATTKRFNVISQREMLRRYGEDEMRWTVAEWLPEASCGLLVAPPGNYKTWILSALGFSVATGRPFLGRYKVAGRGPVLFVQQEDPWWMLENRLSKMFEQQEPTQNGSSDDPSYELDCRFVRELDEMPIYWYIDRRLNLTDKAILAEMEQKIAELQPRLVMIDPLYTAVDVKDYMAEGAQRMTALKLMRDKYGCSFIIAHHTTVAGSSSKDRSSIWGSQFLNAWLEFGWRLPEGNEEGNIIIRHFKGSEDPKRLRLKFNITDWNFSVDINEDYTESVSERIEEMILSGDAGSVRDIAEKIGCGKSTVQRIMKKMNIKEEK